MQLSAGSLFFILISQASWLAESVHDGRLVRKSSSYVGRAVSSTGEIIEVEDTPATQMISPSGEPITAGRVVGSVSASGEISAQYGIDSAALLDTRTADLLAEVEDMVLTEAIPESNKIKIIKDIINEELVPDLKKTRDAAETQIGLNLGAINTCNSNSNTQQTSIKSTTEASVGERRTTHVACRDEEKNKEGDKNGKCEELDTFLGAINPPAEMPAGKPREGMVEYVHSMSGYFCPKEPTVTELDDACKHSEKQHSEHKADCDKKQASFEVGFCTWKTELTDECAELSTCYDSAVEAYNKYVTETKELVNKWKVEYASLKKIVCYTDVWMNDADATTVDTDQFAKCKDSTIDTSPMDVEYPAVPAKAACDLSPVKNYPGTTEFVTVEYATFAEYAGAPIPCLTDGKSDNMVATVEPTPAPTEALTEAPTERPTEAATEAPTTTAEPDYATSAPSTTTEAATSAPVPVEGEDETPGGWQLIHYCTHCGEVGSAWVKKNKVDDCGKHCSEMGKHKLIYNSIWNNCRCYDDDHCKASKLVKSTSIFCRHHVYTDEPQ